MERRCFSRPHMTINISASAGAVPLGHVLDMTERGLCLGGAGAMPDGPLDLTLRLPWAIAGQRQLLIQAEPRWHRYADNGHWRLGVRIHADETTELALAALASRYGELTRH